MRRFWMIATFVAVTLAQYGCGDGVAETRRERMARTKENLKNDWGQLNDDLDYLILNEQKSRLSKWKIE